MKKIIETKQRRFVAEIDKKFALDEVVKNALLETNREAFVPKGFKHQAFLIDSLPIGSKQWISSPLTVAKMTQYLQMQGVDNVLEIGCGSGYQAAVLSQLARRVFSIERIESLLSEARERFRTEGMSNVNVKLDDGQNGWRQFAPYERIVFSASATKIPDIIFEQLKEGGVLVAPMVKGNQQIITRFTKQGGSISVQELETCVFVPVLDGVERV